MKNKFILLIIIITICIVIISKLFFSALSKNNSIVHAQFVATPVTNVIVKASDRLPIRMRFESPKVNPSDMVYIICGLDVTVDTPLLNVDFEFLGHDETGEVK